MNLEALAAKYGTDKLEHGYVPFYEKHLPKEPKRILEIGVADGASIRMWADYFPDAEIYGLDLFSAGVEHKWHLENEFDQRECTGKKIKLLRGNQCDWLILEELRKLDFDVIIDDGSHNSRDQLMTFFGLFNGKHYFIEDLHCCGDEPYTQGLPKELRADWIFNDLLMYNQAEDIMGSTYIDFDPKLKIAIIKTL